MIKIYPNFFEQEELARIKSTLDDDLHPVPNTKNVFANKSRNFKVGQKLKQFGTLVYQELLVYNTNGISYPHTDGGYDPKVPWVTTGILGCDNDYTGGNLYFPNIGLSIKLPVNTLFVFPAGDIELYRHGVEEISSGTRMTAVFRFTNLS
jgi:hypothetical protein